MDTAFRSRPFAAYTTGQIKEFILAGNGAKGMIEELRRRHNVANGCVEQMYPSERRAYVDANPNFSFKDVPLLYP